jgi:hypothetical protein
MHRLKPQALADLEAEIASAEDDRDFYRSFLERAEAAGLGLRRGQSLLRRAEDRLAQLGRKRAALLGREQPEPAEAAP